jgi:hypothetical protein
MPAPYDHTNRDSQIGQMTNRYRSRHLALLMTAALIPATAAPLAAQILFAQSPQPVEFGPVPTSPRPVPPQAAMPLSAGQVAPAQTGAQSLPPPPAATAVRPIETTQNTQQPRIIPNVPAIPVRPIGANPGPAPGQNIGSGAQPQVVPGSGPVVVPQNPMAPSQGPIAVQPAPGVPGGPSPRPPRPITVPNVQIMVDTDRANPFQSPTQREQRSALQARLIQNAIDASVRQIEERMRSEIETRIRDLENETQQRIRAQQAAVPAIPAGPTGMRPGMPGQPGTQQRANFLEFRSTNTLVRRTEVGAGVPENWRLVGCINGRTIYNDGKVTFEHDDGEAGSNCGRRRPDSVRMQ